MRKEWWHITRDKTSFILLLASPVLLLITMGYAFSIDITNVGIGILDYDLSPLSRQYIAQLSSTDALSLDAWPENMERVCHRPPGHRPHLFHADGAAVQEKTLTLKI